MVGNVPRESIANNQVPETVIVKISKYRIPAPVSFCYPGIESDFTEYGKIHGIIFHPGSLIKLESISYILVAVIVPVSILVHLIAVWRHHHFLAVIILRV